MAEEVNNEEEEVTNVSNIHKENISRLISSISESTEMRTFDDKSKLDRALKDYLDEFMTCYRVFGYDESGRVVTFDKSHNAMERSAIDSLFVEQFNSYFEKKMMGG